MPRDLQVMVFQRSAAVCFLTSIVFSSRHFNPGPRYTTVLRLRQNYLSFLHSSRALQIVVAGISGGAGGISLSLA